MPTVRVRLPARSQSYEIKINAGLLRDLGPDVRACLGKGTQRAALISDQTVFKLYGRSVTESLRGAGLTVNHLLIGRGERHKSFRALEKTVAFLTQSKLERSDVVIALGGGVVGDLAGFAAAIYLRGIAFIQVPTTLLAQIDASVGGKTAINLSAGKNLVGAFHQPRLVVIDTDTLKTLPERELTAGWCEAVKQGAAGSRRLFDQTVAILRKREIPSRAMAATVAAHCRFKASIVSGDERESLSRFDHRSRRILNFGHTTAHALETVTGYRRFRHGEAVGYGMLVAAEISKSLGMLPPDELELVREAVALCGPLPRANDLAPTRITKAMASDKKSTAGNLKWVLLERIGRARIVDGSEIEPTVLADALRAGLRETKNPNQSR
ncbi:MAG TPA: 3-dehydroquinate synthase [Pyrinomonadaceae bacterium]|nr:3-dehydroquinate synthase [Pyrinomonadaceae bacterium]